MWKTAHIFLGAMNVVLFSTAVPSMSLVAKAKASLEAFTLEPPQLGAFAKTGNENESISFLKVPPFCHSKSLMSWGISKNKQSTLTA